MNISGISMSGYIKRIKSLEKRITRKWRYTPDPDYIWYLLNQSITAVSEVTGEINYNYDLHNEIIEYMLSEDFKAEHGLIG